MSWKTFITVQNEDGSFTLDSNFAENIGIDLQKMEGVCESFEWSKKVWATALALGYLNEKFQESRSSWCNAEEKCINWLKGNVSGERVPEDTIQYVLDTGKNFIYNVLISASVGPVPYRPLVNPNK